MAGQYEQYLFAFSDNDNEEDVRVSQKLSKEIEPYDFTNIFPAGTNFKEIHNEASMVI